ncbi:G/T mismatches repair enzyme [uncultured archaeon]|nr:G/T mismatches repair enzyme [uncultured archaeon]
MTNIGIIIRLLEKRYPGEFHGAQVSRHPFKVLIGTMLSHQTQDPRTIKAERRLFAVYRTPRELAAAPVPNIQELIRPVGIYRVKARRIKEASRILVERFSGRVPRDYDALISLPGVGRKTANIVFTYAFGKSDFISVDTHVHKVANRLGLVKTNLPDKTEQALYRAVPRRYWPEVNDLFVQHGQAICRAKPKCFMCPLVRYCAHYRNVVKPKRIPGSFTPPTSRLKGPRKGL